jgi:peptidoglycan hydrolase-like protein with peptidoglycan-binding domain
MARADVNSDMAMRTLSKGMQGPDVKDLQAALNYHLRPPNAPLDAGQPPRPPLDVDGDFGGATDRRLREFQRLNGLVDDGIVGRNTLPLLFKAKQVTVKIPVAPDDGKVSAAPAIRAGVRVAQIGPSLPRVGQATAPLIAPVQLQNRQVQIGGNLTLDPIVGPGAPAKALFLAVQWTWVEQRDGRHLEIALGSQLAAPLTIFTAGLAASAQSFAQVSVADVLAIDPLKLHLFSPSAQISYQANVVDGVLKSMSAGVSVQNQIAWDMTKDASGKNPVITIFCQQQLAWTYDFADRKGTIAPSFLLGATWQTSFF